MFKSCFITYLCISLIFIGVISGCQERQPSVSNVLKESLEKARITLPNGWSLTPPGKQLPLGDLPLNMAISPDRTYLAVTNNGQSTQSLMVFNLLTEELVAMKELNRSWVGIDFNSGGDRIYVSGGNDNNILAYTFEHDSLVIADTLVIGTPNQSAGFGEYEGDNMSIAGIVVDSSESFLYTVTKEDSSLYVYDLGQQTVHKRVPLPAAAYTCLLSRDGAQLYISVWGGKKVLVYDVQKEAITAQMDTDTHPNDMVLSKDGYYLYVANANANTVSVIDTRELKTIETISSSLYPDAPTGSTPNGVALSEDNKRLFIANADNNCLAVFDVSVPGQSASLGFIPTGWYPTSVNVVGEKIYVANGKGLSSAANPNGPDPYQRRTDETEYIGRMFTGVLSIIDMPDQSELATYSQIVYENTPYKGNEGEPAQKASDIIALGPNSPVKYVFYVIKENRTYDQIFGDIEEGNGDPTLCLFPDSVTPNQHALAREFVLLDNFYVDAEVSADGHNWSTAAYANDYIEKTWPTLYSGRGGTYDYEGGGKDIAYPDEGFIWDYCQRAGISYRSYGAFTFGGEARIPGLEGHISTTFPGYDTKIKDIERFEYWKKDFDSLLAINQVPHFNTVRFGNDHTDGARIGSPTPAAMVADNDLAVGKLVDYISHSSIWEESAIFVLEDDAQNGPDHVDAHRSIALVVSPYVKRKAVVSDMYSTCSMLRTMELILGLPPMSQYDAAATPFYACFTNTPDNTPYKAIPNQIDLDEKNVEVNSLSKLSDEFDLSREDAAPDILFNEVIWKTVRGIDEEMPAPKRSAFVRLAEDEEEEYISEED